jgi:hypothetical protein
MESLGGKKTEFSSQILPYRQRKMGKGGVGVGGVMSDGSSREKDLLKAIRGL